MTQHEEFDIDLNKNIETIKQVLYKDVDDAPEIFRSVFNYYQSEYAPLLVKEYLSHIISAMEKLVRKITNNEVFVIELQEKEIEDDQYSRGIDIFSSETDENLSAFIINYPKTSDHALLRIGIAHELGHLFEEILKIQYDRDITHNEEFCSLFALIIMTDRSNFYKYISNQYAPSLFQILRRISFIHESRTKNTVNLSGKTTWSQ